MAVMIWILGGAVAGAGVGMILNLTGIGVELLDYINHGMMQYNTESGLLSEIFNNATKTNVLLICTIIGVLLGLVYGIITKMIKDGIKNDLKNAANNKEKALANVAISANNARKTYNKSEEALETKKKWTKELQYEASTVCKICDENQSTGVSLVHNDYQANGQMKRILIEFSSLTELQGKVESIAEEVIKKGGTQ